MECEQVRDKLVEFMDNEAPDEMRKPIQAHLDGCAECSKELELLRGVTELCQEWKDISPSKSWRAGLRRKLVRVNRGPMSELELLRGAVIGLSRRVQELEESHALPSVLESGIMTINDLARYLRLSVDQIYDMIDQLPKFQIGYEYRFRRESIDQWIRSLEQKPYNQEYLWSDWSREEE